MVDGTADGERHNPARPRQRWMLSKKWGKYGSRGDVGTKHWGPFHYFGGRGRRVELLGESLRRRRRRRRRRREGGES